MVLQLIKRVLAIRAVPVELLEATKTRLQRKLEHFFAARAADVARQLAKEMRLAGWQQL
jgi:hypothetical protein